MGDGCDSWHACSSWTWNAGDDACGICHQEFDACCPDCKVPGDDCAISASAFYLPNPFAWL